MDWTGGYQGGIDYTHGDFHELSPGLIDFSLLLAGFAPPEGGGERTYLELGYGQGLSVNIHAAATPGRFHGVDFNPAHALQAQTLAEASGARAAFTGESFTDLLARNDLPDMDYIVLHGVWSWVSDETRRTILEVVARRLKIGGVVYIGYATTAALASVAPLRHLLALHARTAAASGETLNDRMDAALGFGARVGDTAERFMAANPAARSLLETLPKQDRRYLAHEYFGDFWTPQPFSEVSTQLGTAGLQFAAPARLLDHIDGVNLAAAQRTILDDLADTALRETTRDLLLNREFRRDLFTRDARRLTAAEQRERIDGVAIALTVAGVDQLGAADTGLGRIALPRDSYAAIIEALSFERGRPRTIGDLRTDPALQALPVGALLRRLAILVGAGYAHPAQGEDAIAAARPHTRRLNAHLIERARVSGDMLALASPVIGAGVGVGRVEQMFLSARALGLESAADLASLALGTLVEDNVGIVRDGKGNYPPPIRTRDQAATTPRMVWNLLTPGLRRAVSMTVRISASPWAAHMAR